MTKPPKSCGKRQFGQQIPSIDLDICLVVSPIIAFFIKYYLIYRLLPLSIYSQISILGKLDQTPAFRSNSKVLSLGGAYTESVPYTPNSPDPPRFCHGSFFAKPSLGPKRKSLNTQIPCACAACQAYPASRGRLLPPSTSAIGGETGR